MLTPVGTAVMGPDDSATSGSTRQKSEVTFTGLNLTIPTTATNLINLVKNLSHTGSLAPFFNVTTNKLNVFNVGATVTFKLNIIGTWGGSSINRSMTVSFPSTTGNTLVESRDAVVMQDILSLSTFFSVDKDGNLATSGSDITIQSNGGTFTATTILLIAEQMVPNS